MTYFDDDDMDDMESGDMDDDMEFAMEADDMEEEQIDMYYAGLQQRLLVIAIKTLEKSFWWRFYRTKTKLRLIRETYRGLVQILES